jgi:BlaI family transcriptional regulator, penicillinase repressor
MRLSSTEWTVMNVVWERQPVTARDVHDQVTDETGWAFDTVRTILNRLAKKGALKSELRNGTAYFTPLLSREEARQSALSWIAEKAFGGAREAMMQFLVSRHDLSTAERETLRKLLAELDDKES